MSWELYRSTMERHAIKTDDMATEDAYFMATHMPFSSLELFRGGYYEEGKSDYESCDYYIYGAYSCLGGNIHKPQDSIK